MLSELLFKLAGLFENGEIVFSELFGVGEDELIAVDGLDIMRDRVVRLPRLHFLSLWLTEEYNLDVLD